MFVSFRSPYHPAHPPCLRPLPVGRPYLNVPAAQRHFSAERKLQDRLRIWKLEKKGRVVDGGKFFEMLKQKDWSGPSRIIARDDKGRCIFESMPDVAVQMKSVRLDTVKRPTPLQLAIKSKDLRKMKALITAGHDVNANGKGLEPPLFHAVRTGNPAVVNLLMEHGANPGLYETSSWNYNITAYHLAIQLGHSRVVRLFLERWKVPADQSVAFYDYGWPPEAFDFAVPGQSEKLSSFKMAEIERILVLLLQKNGKQFIRNSGSVYQFALQNKMCQAIKLFHDLGHIKTPMPKWVETLDAMRKEIKAIKAGEWEVLDSSELFKAVEQAEKDRNSYY